MQLSGFERGPLSPILRRWSRALATLIVLDPEVEKRELPLRTPYPGKLSWGAFRTVLGMIDVVVEEKRVGEHEIYFLRVRRNCCISAPPPSPPTLRVGPEGSPILEGERPHVIEIVHVENEAGNEILATLRPLVVGSLGDVRWNVVYVRGPELIIVEGLSEDVARLARIAQRMGREPRDDLRGAIAVILFLALATRLRRV